MSGSDKTGLILHRQGFDSCYKPRSLNCQTTGGKVSFFIEVDIITYFILIECNHVF